VLTAVFAASAFAIAIATPPRSGPNCSVSCISYPYTTVASFVPNDYLWMYPGILVVLAFVVLMNCIHHSAPEDKKVFSQVGLSFALISATIIATDYFIQLAVVQPSLLKGEVDSLSLFSQYNPHGIFIGLEDVGYLMMSAAFLFAGMTFVGPGRVERALRWIFVVSALAAIMALIGLSLYYGAGLEYRFEVAVLAINWSVLVVSGVLLSLLFRRTGGTE